MTNQTTGQGNIGSASSPQAGDIVYFMRVTMFIELLCMGYVLSQPKHVADREPDRLLPDTTGQGDWPGLPSWQRKVSEKAVARYAGSQEKKWQRWNEAMFQPTDSTTAVPPMMSRNQRYREKPPEEQR